MYLAIKLAKQNIAMIIIAAVAITFTIAPVVSAVGVGEECGVAPANAVCDNGLVCNNNNDCENAVAAAADDDIFGANYNLRHTLYELHSDLTWAFVIRSRRY